nr:PKD domain-containing protein [Bacteroidota bacterium]
MLQFNRNYSVSLIACNTTRCDTITFVNFLHVLTSPKVNLGNDTLICAGDTLSLSAGGGNTSYLWSTSATSQTINVTAPGTYYVTVSNSTCNAKDTIIVATQSCLNAVANFSASDSLFCDKKCINFTDISQNNPTTWQWTFNGAVPSTSTNQNPTNICYNNGGSFAVTLIACNQFGCDTLIRNNFITSQSQPTINLGNDTTICIGEILTLNAGAGYISYLWSTSGTSQSLNVSVPGTYYVNVSNGTCNAKDTIIVGTQSCLNAIANFSASDSLFCDKKCIDFTDISQNNPTTWQWTFNGAIPPTSTSQNPTNICYNNPGSFAVTLIACNQFGCDTLTRNSFITSQSQPVINLGNDTIICIGDTITLNSGGGNSSYLWNTGATSQSINVSTPGTYYVSVSDGVCNVNDTITVATQTCAAVAANFTCNDSLFCEKQCIDFTDISQNNPVTWQWSFSGASPSSSTDQNPSGVCYNIYGSFDVTLIACNQFSCDTITKNNFITSYITPFDSIWFANDTLFALPAYSYQWFEVGAGLIANATQNFYVPLTLGNYYCITKDTDGCESTSNVILYTSFFENENSEIANAIWPNPASEILFVNPELVKSKNIMFEIYDMQGRIILQQMLRGNNNSINIAHLSCSVYSYRIMTKEKIIAQGRFIKGH